MERILGTFKLKIYNVKHWKLIIAALEVTTRDYKGSLIHLLSVFKENNVNLSCVETRKLNYIHK